ncbi:MAG: type II toxin-antitoxin system RelE/ParE family toxin [Chloroflexi bacterium]|nr:type II toxin-antitoxin system RelE/ParE family toxin [Chloroflexota bacterium]
MTYNVQLTASFKRSVKKLKRRYSHIKDDVREGVELLLQIPRLGVIVPGSGGIRKVRLPNRDAKRGKSGGYRLLYYLEDNESQTLYLLFVYSKSDRANVTRRELKQLLDEMSEN